MALRLKLLLIVLVLLLAITSSRAQSNEWTWMGGSSTLGAAGVYGTLGQPDAANMPGCRQGAAESKDAAGHVWVFGGQGCSDTGTGDAASLNDLWEYDPSANEWTWWGGSNSVNCPAHPCGESGVYGTLGQPSAENIPGGRFGASSWIDSNGNFWLFGGQGYDSVGVQGNLNDLWEFDSSTQEWKWVSGSQVSSSNGSPGVYGTLGDAAAANTPGSRYFANSWIDSSKHLWLFGGYGTGANTTNQGPLNDLWQFDLSTGQWTWMSGSSTLVNGMGNTGVYGSLGVPATGNIPGGRYYAAGWSDSQGHFFLFGGWGSNATAGSVYLNDLWKFNSGTGEWTWLSGSSTAGNVLPTYGTLGSPSPANVPGGRETPAGWSDSNGSLWLFGGFGPITGGNPLIDFGEYNDLWKFDPSSAEWTWMGGSNTVPIIDGGYGGVYGTLGTPSSANIPGARYSAAYWTDSQGNLWLFGGLGQGEGITGTGYLNDLWEYKPLAPLQPSATPSFSVPAGTYSAAQTVTISDTTPAATIYYTTDGTTPTASSTQYTAPITVSSTETIQAIATASGYANSAIASATYTINPPPPTFTVGSGASSLTISPGGSGNVTLTVTPQNGFNGSVTSPVPACPRASRARSIPTA